MFKKNAGNTKKSFIILIAIAALMLVMGLWECFDACSVCGGSGDCKFCHGSGACNICYGSGGFQGMECPGCTGGRCTFCKGDGQCYGCD